MRINFRQYSNLNRNNSKMSLVKMPQLVMIGLLLSISLSITTENNLLSLVTTQQAVLEQPVLMAPVLMNTLVMEAACKQNQVKNYQSSCIKPTYIEGCQVYQSSSSCYKCVNGYLLSKSKMCDFQPLYLEVINHIIGCIKQSSDNVCSTCASGFYKNHSSCQLGVKNCVQYTTEGICIKCQAQHSLMLSQCLDNSLLGCKFQTEFYGCSQCYAPFQLEGQHCNIQECKILNDYGCVACECGFYLTAERACKPIVPGCLRYERGFCKDCLKHYKLKGGVCQIEGCLAYEGNYCRQCAQNYQLVEGQCSFQNCADWLNDACLACNDGFGVKNGVCVSIKSLACQ